MDLAHGTYCTGLDKFHNPPVIIGRVNLRSHLRGHSGLDRLLGEQARFPHVVGQWFFAIDMLAEFEGRQHGEGVRVFGRGHDDRVNVLALVVKLAEVHIFARLRVFGGGGIQVLLVHVAEGDDVFAADLGHVLGAASAGANDGNVELIIGGEPPWLRASDRWTGERHGTGGDGGAAKELAAGQRA